MVVPFLLSIRVLLVCKRAWVQRTVSNLDYMWRRQAMTLRLIVDVRLRASVTLPNLNT